MKVHCFAKINLYLNISYKRLDNFHEIQSLFQSISLFDTLTLTSSDAFKLDLSEKSADFADPNLLKTNNLLEKVFNYFTAKFDVFPLHVVLNKQIPIGAGLGGGSADAAGLIMALNSLNCLFLSQETLKQIGSLFGSDVPFFIQGGMASVTGRGEKVELIETNLPSLKLILIYPGIHINTKKAYEDNAMINDQLNFSQIIDLYRYFPDSLNSKKKKKYLAKIAKFSYNGFERQTLKRYPKILAAYSDLKQYSDYVLLSGSGSCVFALFEERHGLKEITKTLQTKYRYVYLLQTNNQGVFLQ